MAISKQDLEFIEQQLGRKPRGIVEISVRSKDGNPLVVKTKPILVKSRESGAGSLKQIFPTLYYLVDMTVIEQVFELESKGLINQLQERINSVEEFKKSFLAAQRAYKKERNSLINFASLSESQKEALNTGIGGVKDLTRIKCLHAHLAHYLATHQNPVGEETWGLVSGVRSYKDQTSKPDPVRAAIDIGTNSTRLLVARFENKQQIDIHRKAIVTRLGQSVDKNKELAPEAIDRTIKVLADYKTKAFELGADNITVGTTSAARDATNIKLFIDMVKAQTNLDVKVLSSNEEANLSYLGATGCLRNIKTEAESMVVIDIGGGSTEVSAGKITNMSPDLFFSKDIGSVRLTEMFIKNDPPFEEELKKAADYIVDAYQRTIENILTKYENFLVIGTAGTITSLSAISQNLPEYQAEKVHCSKLSIQSVENILGRLKAQTTKERETIKVLQAGRADVIVMGTLILFTLMKLLKIEELIVSEADILDGLLQNTN